MHNSSTYKMFTYQSKHHPAWPQPVRMPSILDERSDVQAEMNNTWCFIPQDGIHTVIVCVITLCSLMDG